MMPSLFGFRLRRPYVSSAQFPRSEEICISVLALVVSLTQYFLICMIGAFAMKCIVSDPATFVINPPSDVDYAYAKTLL